MTQKKVVTASESPVKINAVKNAFRKVFYEKEFEIISVSVKSGVADQPLNNSETFQGAKNRADNAKKKIPQADFWIGIEGGTEKNGNETEAFAWVYIISENKTGKARTASFFLPKKITDLINKGYELGDADDIIFKQKNSKKKTGAVGILTRNIISRSDYYSEAVILALIPVINNDLY
ncbi:MAG: non-canonical purine NTP phosphatase [Chlorobi bacterium]|nr:non-canonical purine NTP phosphatase [Chlorobiota bacterium]